MQDCLIAPMELADIQSFDTQIMRPAVHDDSIVLQVDHLSKSYGAHKVLKEVSFHVRQGEIFGLLGQNGAGKTTILEIIEGLRAADDGCIFVLGHQLPEQMNAVRARLGVSLQTADFWGQMRVREVVDLFRSFYKRSLPAAHLMAIAGLEEFQGRQLKRNRPVWTC